MILTTEQIERQISLANFSTVSWTSWDRAKIVEEIRTNGYLYSILGKLARACVSVNFMVGRYSDDGAFSEEKNHPLYKLLLAPNPYITDDDMREAAAIDFFSFGECFIFVERYMAGNNAGEFIPGTMRLLPAEIMDMKVKGTVVEGYILNGNYSAPIPPDNIIHIKNYNPKWDDFHGLSYVSVAGSLIDKLKAANETETKTYQNSGPAYLVAAKNQNSFLDEEYLSFIGRLKKAWRNATNKRGVIGTSGSVDVHKLGESPQEMGAIDSQINTVRVMLVMWGLDPGLFDVTASTYNNKITMERAVYTECAIPFLKKFYGKIQAKAAKAYDDIVIELDTSDIEALQANYKEKVEWMRNSGVFTDNEIRSAVAYDKRDSEVSEKTPNELVEMDAVSGFDDENLNKPVI